MTENKRFTMDNPNDWGFPITDNDSGKVYSCASNQLMKDLCDLINEIVKENEELKHNNKMLSMKMSEVSTKYRLLKEFSDDTNPNEAVKTVLHELMMITKEYK